MRRSKRISLRVPAGVDSGSRLRVRGEGNAGRRGGPPGDLYVFITVQPDPELKRDGININSSVSVAYTDAILGTSVKVRTVDGMVDLKIPAGIQPGSTLLMAKRGVPRLGNPTIKARRPRYSNPGMYSPSRDAVYAWWLSLRSSDGLWFRCRAISW